MRGDRRSTDRFFRSNARQNLLLSAMTAPGGPLLDLPRRFRDRSAPPSGCHGMDSSPTPAILAHPTPEVVYAVACAYLPDALRLLRVPPGDADDILHDVVLAAYSGLERYDPELFHDGRNE